MDSSGETDTSMSDTERAKLAKELDDDLDRFIDDLIKQKDLNQPKKPFVYDEWCKEIDQHPAFMTVLRPDKNGEFSEGIQALQALKYEEDEWEDRRATAERHKIDGNKHFKYKKYHWAINRYTDGINQRCTDRCLNSILYANRAAAQKHIGNIGSAFRDCFFARKFDPENMKAIIRGAECLVELGRGRQCIDWLKISEENSKRKTHVIYNDCKSDSHYLNELYAKAQQLAIVEERDERKKRREAEKDLIAKQRLLSALKERNINFQPAISFDNPELFEWSQIEVQLASLKESRNVYIDDCDVLHWPILAQYPEIGKVDLVTDCSEKSSISDVFNGVFLQQASSDGSDSMFNCDNVRYFVSLDLDKEYDSAELMPWSKIRDAFSIPGFIVMQGLPTIQIYTKEHAEANFLKIENCFYKTK